MTDVRAYVLLKVSSGSERETCNTMGTYPSVSLVNMVYGEYDVLVEVQAGDMQELDSVIDKIRTISSVTFTSTLVVGREYKNRGKLVKPSKPQSGS
jgi:DNA-binding Lrp family transcriptional regulator